MNENNTSPTEPEEKVEAPITDAGHLIEPESEDHTELVATEPAAAAPETPVRQLEEASASPISGASPAPSSEAEKAGQNSGGVLVLQWLSYAFWFWFGISMSWLAGVVINYFVSGSEGYQWSEALAYPLASVIILFIIAIITDKFYSKHEPAKKTGGANVIMLLHVVPFVLIAIGSLVTVVFSLISMLLNSDPVASTDGPIIVMAVSLIVAVMFTLAAGRAFYGGSKKVRLAIWAVFAALAIGFIVAGFAGPASEAIRTKQDRLIEQALPSLSSDIRSYASKNDKLPATLGDVTHESSYTSDAVQKLIDSGLAEYKANTLPSDNGNSSSPSDDVAVSGMVGGSSYYKTTVKRFYYQLCTTYRYEKKDTYNYSDTPERSYTVGSGVGVKADYRNEYVTSISAHPAGNVCYNLYADGKYDYGLSN